MAFESFDITRQLLTCGTCLVGQPCERSEFCEKFVPRVVALDPDPMMASWTLWWLQAACFFFEPCASGRCWHCTHTKCSIFVNHLKSHLVCWFNVVLCLLVMHLDCNRLTPSM
jgi:hypothetical protein